MARKVWLLAIIFILSICIASASAAAEAPSSLELVIPDYKVTTIGNLDYVEIPEGEILIAEEGRPRVPYYVKSIDYPKGYRVQDVILKERSGLVTVTGLRLPVVILSQSPKAPVEMKQGWYPEEEYNWRLWENPDGSTTLVITVYPFYYNPETTDVKFYRDYLFDIDCILSSTTITALYTDKDFYEPGDKVAIEIGLKNSGEAQNIVVSAIIKQYGSDETVDSLPLRTLKDLVGDASLAVEWDSHNFSIGDYLLEATLLDTVGNVLDLKRAGIIIMDAKDIPTVTTQSSVPHAEGEIEEFPTNYIIIITIGAIVIVAAIIFFIIWRRTRS